MRGLPASRSIFSGTPNRTFLIESNYHSLIVPICDNN
jgi:hypothetical protein